MITNRIQLNKSHDPDKWSHDVPTDAKEFYFIPRVFLLRTFPLVNNTNYKTDEVVDIDMSLTPLYVKESQEVIMRIVENQLQIRVRDIQ